MLFDLSAGLAGNDVHGTLRLAAALPGFSEKLPAKVRVDGTVIETNTSWRDALQSASKEARAMWDPYEKQLAVVLRSQMVVVSLLQCFASAAEGRGIVEPLPFEICSLGSVFFDQWIKAGYQRWSFGRSHFDHGWGCAFRGAGHDRLHSRRWLEYGPWRVIRRPNDTTFIQFHDLAITDPAEAYAQAKVGHQRMGIDPIGGFIQGIDLDVIAEVRGVYRAETRTLEIVVPAGTEVTQQDMRVACGLRLHHKLTRPMVDRIEQIAYVFVAKADAEAHLHELWLRELGCWYLDEGGKHRLDADYHPTPSPPAWVAAVEARGE